MRQEPVRVYMNRLFSLINLVEDSPSGEVRRAFDNLYSTGTHVFSLVSLSNMAAMILQKKFPKKRNSPKEIKCDYKT